jgi:hypothetical protein
MYGWLKSRLNAVRVASHLIGIGLEKRRGGKMEDWKYQISLALPENTPDKVLSDIYDIVENVITQAQADFDYNSAPHPSAHYETNDNADSRDYTMKQPLEPKW